MNQSIIYLCILEKPSKLYFDLEFDIIANPKINGPKLTTNFIQVYISIALIYDRPDGYCVNSDHNRRFIMETTRALQLVM